MVMFIFILRSISLEVTLPFRFALLFWFALFLDSSLLSVSLTAQLSYSVPLFVHWTDTFLALLGLESSDSDSAFLAAIINWV